MSGQGRQPRFAMYGRMTGPAASATHARATASDQAVTVAGRSASCGVRASVARFSSMACTSPH